jgi:hypothetical protein
MLANHGFINRSGSNILVGQLVQVIEDVYSLNAATARVIIERNIEFGWPVNLLYERDHHFVFIGSLHASSIDHDASL